MKKSVLIVIRSTACFLAGCFIVYVVWYFKDRSRPDRRMSDRTLDYFLSQNRIQKKDGADLRWCHAVNSRGRLTEALSGPSHMVEADIILRGSDPVMGHPPDTDSDITLRAWLEGVKEHNMGIKLDFKSLEAVVPSVVLLEEVLADTNRPVWVNADILSGPGGRARPLEPRAFLSAVRALPPHTMLSLGWTTGWTAGMDNPGYSWEMVQIMAEICRDLQHSVTFPVRASLLARSFPQLTWLLQQSDRYTLTVWTDLKDQWTLQDLLPYRKELDTSRIYYDLPDSLRTELAVMSRDRS